MSPPFRVVAVEPLPDWIRGLYEQQIDGSGLELEWASGDDVETAIGALGGVDAILTGKRRVGDAIIAACGSGLALIQVQGRAPWAVDLAAARGASVPVACMPHRGAIAVAEHTLALALGLYRKLVAGHRHTAAADYRSGDVEPIETDERTIAFNWMGFDDLRQLYGKVLGLVGLGDIGLEVARRARAFDMKILYTKQTPIAARFEEQLGIRGVSFPELLSDSDIVTLHAPHTARTEGMIDAAALGRMKPDAVLINTSRGGLVDEEALAASLRGGKIAGAGLDVFRREPLPEGHPFMELDNVLLCPHVGGGSGGGQKGLVADVIANIGRVAAGEAPRHVVGHGAEWR